MARDDRGALTDRPDGRAPPRRPPASGTGVDRRLAALTGRRTFVALQFGATLSGTISGLLLYALLLDWHVNGFVALLVGFLFALLARRAATTLMIEWFAARGARRPGDPAAPAEPRRE
jgi:hypothetical protein